MTFHTLIFKVHLFTVYTKTARLTFHSSLSITFTYYKFGAYFPPGNFWWRQKCKSFKSPSEHQTLHRIYRELRRRYSWGYQQVPNVGRIPCSSIIYTLLLTVHMIQKEAHACYLMVTTRHITRQLWFKPRQTHSTQTTVTESQ